MKECYCFTSQTRPSLGQRNQLLNTFLLSCPSMEDNLHACRNLVKILRSSNCSKKSIFIFGSSSWGAAISLSLRPGVRDAVLPWASCWDHTKVTLAFWDLPSMSANEDDTVVLPKSRIGTFVVRLRHAPCPEHNETQSVCEWLHHNCLVRQSQCRRQFPHPLKVVEMHIEFTNQLVSD